MDGGTEEEEEPLQAIIETKHLILRELTPDDRKRDTCIKTKKLLLLWSGELISAIGGGLTIFGLTVYIFSKTGRAAGTALIALLTFFLISCQVFRQAFGQTVRTADS